MGVHHHFGQRVPDSRGTEGALGLQQAQQALQEQQWHLATEHCESVLQTATSNKVLTQTWLTLARALWHQGELVGSFQAALQCQEAAQRGADVASAISAATLAAFALAELDWTEPALELARRALDLAQRPSQFKLLPTALSCAAHVNARRADLEASEHLHMRALSFARESGDVQAMQLAYDNLMLSFSMIIRTAQAASQARLTEAVSARARNYAPQIRSLLEHPQLDEWRRISLMHQLGEMLCLCGDLDEAEPLLQNSLKQALNLDASYSSLTIQTALAELYHRKGEPDQALIWLRDSLALSDVAASGYQRHLRALCLAETCYRSVGQTSSADALALRASAARAGHEAMRTQLAARSAWPLRV